MLYECHAVEGFGALIVAGLGIDCDASQQGVEIGDVLTDNEGALESGAALLEHVIGCDDQQIDIRVVPRAAFGNGTANDQSSEIGVVAASFGETIDDPLVMIVNLHTVVRSGSPQ